ncbi:MAG: DNA primase [Steroidobacteraceae bacterium]
MAGRIPQHFIDELIARCDIVELIGSRVELKKAGREYKACCPFHNEKTPSFWVSPAKQFYHCFGCGAHGTALSFLMEFDRLSFPDAIAELAQRLGLEVPRDAPADAAERQRDELQRLNDDVARYFQQQLRADKRANEYLRRRGLAGDDIERFALGFADPSWNALLQRFGTDRKRLQHLAELGLIIARDGGSEGYYDRFRDRIMFPIRDIRGRVLGFGGRVLDAGEPKYLNSPESPLFHKGHELYGLYEVRQQRDALRRLLVVEGYMDVVRLHQAGIGYAVATLGTATTAQHLQRAFRLVREVVFAFDGDTAGRRAAWRALGNALGEAREGREIRFVFLPEGEDPDSLVAKEGRQAFEQRLDAAEPLSEFLVRGLAADLDLAHADGRARFAAAAKPLVAAVPDGVYKALLISRIADEIGLPATQLQDLWVDANGARPASAPGASHKRPPRPASRMRPGRGNLLTQALAIALHYPAAAAAIDDGRCEALARSARPGVDVLSEILAQLRATPGLTMGGLLERWRGHRYEERLAELSGNAPALTDESAAARELTAAVDRLIAGEVRERIDALIARGDQLSAEEKQELQALMSKVGDGEKR